MIEEDDHAQNSAIMLISMEQEDHPHGTKRRMFNHRIVW